MQLTKIKDKLLGNNKSFLCLLITLFMLKGVFYAAYIIPLTMGTSPDDVGHFSYIQYIASQRRLPVHHQATFESSTLNAFNIYWDTGEVIDFVIGDENFDTYPHRNWIVQHPPLYYILMSVIYGIASFFTRQFSHMILILRLANLVFGVASIVYINRILDILNTKDVVRKCVLLFFVFSAPLQFNFSTITNDGMLIFVCIFALYYLLRYVNSNRLKDFIIFVIGSALIFATKYNGFMVMFTYVGFFLYHSIRYNGFKETVKLSLIGIPIGLAIILPDLLFNYFTMGSLITSDGGLVTGIDAYYAHHYSFAHFLFRRNYAHNITRHIILLIGWNNMITADRFISLMFAGLFIFLVLIHCYKCRNKVYVIFVFLIGVATFSILSYTAKAMFIFAIARDAAGFAQLTSFVIACASMLLCFAMLKTKGLDSKERDIHILFIATLVVMVLVYAYTHYGLLQYHGVLRAMNGRYYYIAFFPFVYLLFYQLGEVKSKVIQFVPPAITLFLAIVEFHTISMTLASW